MLHLFGGDTTTAEAPWRLPRLSKLPWRKMLVAAIVLIALAGIGYGAKNWIASRGSENASEPTVSQPVQLAVENPAVPSPQVLQNVQENVGAAAPRVVDYRVTWTEVKNFDPSTIPVEEGFYKGGITYNTSSGINPNDPTDIPEMTAYAWKILPQLEGERALWNKSINLAATRDQSNKDIVLVGITADNNFPYILLSADGEKSWCKLTLLPNSVWEGMPTGLAVATRVASQSGEIHLYAQDTRPGNHWWTVTAKKNELPCS